MPKSSVIESPVAKLRRSRKPRWTQAKLAAAAGLSLGAVAVIERRQRRGESGGRVEPLLAIARAFGVDIADVLPKRVPERRR